MAKRIKSILDDLPPSNMSFWERYGYPGCTLEELMENVGKPLSWDLVEKQLAAKEQKEADDGGDALD